jgi:hypothetical protein
MQLSQPQRDAIDGEFIEQGREKSFRQRFEQLRFLNGSDIDDTLSHGGIVDGLGQIVGQSCRSQPTVQFQIGGEELRTSAFFEGHTTAAAELQLLDHDKITHGGIVEDRLPGCQATNAMGWKKSGGRLLRLDEVTAGIEFVFGVVNQPNNAAAILTGVVFLS